jgi:hypothetical protein
MARGLFEWSFGLWGMTAAAYLYASCPNRPSHGPNAAADVFLVSAGRFVSEDWGANVVVRATMVCSSALRAEAVLAGLAYIPVRSCGSMARKPRKRRSHRAMARASIPPPPRVASERRRCRRGGWAQLSHGALPHNRALVGAC